MKNNFISIMLIALLGMCAGCNSGTIIHEYDVAEYSCPHLVNDKNSAAACFNIFFEEQLTKIKEERGEVPEDLIKLFQKVKVEDIVEKDGNYYIIRNGYGNPYYIENSIIMRFSG